MEKNNETLNINLLNAKNGNDYEFDISNYDLKGFFNEYNGDWYIDKDLLLNHSKKLSKNGYDYYITTDGTDGYTQLYINKEIADAIIDIIRVSEITTEKMNNSITNKTSKREIKVMKNFDLKYNLFDDEIKMLSHFLDRDKNGYGEYEGDDGWLKDNESINIIEGQLNQMKENRNLSKKIILDVLNDKDEKYPMNVKLFYITNVETVINEKNEFLYDGNNVEDSKNILKDMVVDYFKNGNFISSIINYDKIEEFAKKLVNDTSISVFEKCDGNLGNVIGEYINNNQKLCIEMFGDEKENNIQNEGLKIHNQKDFEKLSEFASKLEKAELNELQNILIQCEYDNKVLSDFTSAVDKVVVNKNVEENYLPVDTMMIYNTRTSDFYDISMADKNGDRWLSFEMFVNILNDYKNDNLVVVQAKLPTFKEFGHWDNAIIKGMFAVAKDNGNKLMDFVTVNVDNIKKNGEGQYNFKSIIDKDCYSYKFKTKQNVKIHFNKLEVNEELKSKQGLYANEAQAQKIETATAKLK